MYVKYRLQFFTGGLRNVDVQIEDVDWISVIFCGMLLRMNPNFNRETGLEGRYETPAADISLSQFARTLIASVSSFA